MSDISGDGEQESQWDAHLGDTSWREEGDDLYEEIIDRFVENYPDFDDAAAELVYDGWFNPEADNVALARMALFEFYDIEIEDFPWDDWRDWYES